MKKKQVRHVSNGSAHPVEKKKVAIRTDIPVEHAFPADQKATYANHFTVQHENGVYHLMFFQINPPLALGTHEDKAKQLRELKSVQATCVSRMVVADELLPKIIEALIDNYNTQQARAAGNVELVDVSSLSTTKKSEST